MKKLVAALLLAAVALPAHAGTHCYTPEQVKAERLLRLHSELMVITVACRQSSTGRDLSGAYTGFTRSNIAALHDAEATLTSFYKAAYGGKGIDRLDTLRTKLANEYGQQMANESAAVFCGQRRDKVVAYEGRIPRGLAEEAERLYASERTYAPVCGIKKAEATGILP